MVQDDYLFYEKLILFELEIELMQKRTGLIFNIMYTHNTTKNM